MQTENKLHRADGKTDAEEMRDVKVGTLNPFGEVAVYISVFFVTLILFLVFKPLYTMERNGMAAQMAGGIFIVGCLFVGAYLKMSGRLIRRRTVVLLFVIGVALRIVYMLYTPANTRQYDTWSSNFNGHEAYAWTLFTTGKLPLTNDYQFCHPPLNALVQAGFMQFFSAFFRTFSPLYSEELFQGFLAAKPDFAGEEEYFLYQSCQILSVLYSVITCFVLLKLLWRMKIHGGMYLMAAAFVIFFPRNFQLSGQLNNDALAYMFSALALYFSVCWQKGGKKWGYLLACGVSIGLGMMTKLTAATICLPVAGIFLWEFVCALRHSEGALSLRRIIGQYAVFLVICAPIGLWFQVYANIRFDQPFGFVFSNLNHRLYTGDHSVFERFFIAFDFNEYFASLWCQPFDGNYNLFHYALRSAIFGEFCFWQGEGFACSATILAYIGCAVLAVGLIRMAVLIFHANDREKICAEENRKDLLFVSLLVLSQVISEVAFYIRMPYACTMDFRYILPMIPALALMIAMVFGRLKRESDAFSVALCRLAALSFGGAILCSSIFYMVCI